MDVWTDDAPLLRPAFGRILDRRRGDRVARIDHGAFELQPSATGRHGSAALVVVGRNRLDPTLFERCAARAIDRYLDDGWTVRVLDLGHGTMESDTPPGERVRRLLAETDRLHHVVFLTHSRNAINLSDSGNDLVVTTPSGEAAAASIPISRLRRSPTAATDGWVDVFGCFCQPDARWAAELAAALGWPVRTVFPGYSIYFPAHDDLPKSAIPFTRALLRSRYMTNGWAVWLPGAARPVRVSEPGDLVRRASIRFDGLERLIVRAISIGLEPVRDIRKKRLLARHGFRP